MARDKTQNRDPFGSRYAQKEEPSETEARETSSKTDKPDSLSKTAETDSMSKTSKSDKPEQTEKTNEKEKTSVKDLPSVLMYLPEEQHTELDIRFDELNAKYKREHGESLQKNRDYYPILIELAMEKTQEMDEDELLTRLNQS
ncbi:MULTISPECIES: hypothetical protein [unclassified Haladaptatus]|uniref:hypothetical protein n=1 Tax=unclassified Haladaptatus TaxID=2622732 RepID=UPI00209C28FF|nr:MULTISPECIES: hypothetical protein [unclassified Haladaptatus]MCO8244890.1 hypothetical protein [Haladaptatus sp. AB643]MCO8255597.1 hypothetical protein [Haladaptatus sp. AB618]